jgi:hypothetical protein
MALIDIFQAFWMAVRIFAAVAGAFVGWLIMGYAVRLLVRLAFHRPTPRPVLTLARILGAIAIGLLVYYYLHPGGSGGWGLGGGGFGLGVGGGPGKGGSGTGTPATVTTEGNATAKPSKTEVPPDTLTIEMLGVNGYKGERRFYLIGGKEPARTLQEVTELLQKNQGRYRKLEILIYPDSVAREHPATSQLAGLADRFGMSLSITRVSQR